MQALSQDNKVVFFRTINGISSRVETTSEKMDEIITQEIMAREFIVSVIKEKFERWARETFICSKDRIYVGINDDDTLYYFTSGCSMVRRIDKCYNAGILHAAYTLANEYGICVTCVHENGATRYEFWIGSK